MDTIYLRFALVMYQSLTRLLDGGDVLRACCTNLQQYRTTVLPYFDYKQMATDFCRDNVPIYNSRCFPVPHPSLSFRGGISSCAEHQQRPKTTRWLQTTAGNYDYVLNPLTDASLSHILVLLSVSVFEVEFRVALHNQQRWRRDIVWFQPRRQRRQLLW